MLWGYELSLVLPLPQSWADFFWGMAKSEIFYVDGACKHSGMCCTGLTLVNQGRVIRSRMQFNKVLVRQPDYGCFIPHTQSDGAISHFSCSHLLPNNRCGNYENRPKICRQYPHSAFMMHDFIPTGCGYRVKHRTTLPFLVSSATSHRLKQIERLNGLNKESIFK